MHLKKIAHREKILSNLSYCKDTGIFTRVDSGKIAGCVVDRGRGLRYSKIVVDGVVYFSHRLAWFYVTGDCPAVVIDHIDGDGLNNRFSNLRLSSHSKNGKNKIMHSNNTSGKTGVVWCKRFGKWMATIMVEKKRLHLGYYFDFSEACAARVSAEIRLGFSDRHGSDVRVYQADEQDHIKPYSLGVM